MAWCLVTSSQRKREQELWSAYQSHRSETNRDALIEFYLPLLRGIASKLAQKLPVNPIWDADALVGAGYPGLLVALERFEPGRGLRFGTFATVRIRGQMLDEMRRSDWVPRLERQRFRAGVVEQTVAMLPLAQLQDDDGNDQQYGHQYAGDLPAPEAHTDCEEFWRDSLKGLDQTDRLIVLLYYREQLTMKQIGQQVGLSESRISQRHDHIIAHIRKRMGAENVPVLPRATPTEQVEDTLTPLETTDVSMDVHDQHDRLAMFDQMMPHMTVEEIDRKIAEHRRLLSMWEALRSVHSVEQPISAPRRLKRNASGATKSRIAEYLRHNGPCTCAELVAALPGLTKSSIQTCLSTTKEFVNGENRTWALKEHVV